MSPQDDRDIRQRAEQWQAETLQAQLAALGERKQRFETDSGIPVRVARLSRRVPVHPRRRSQHVSAEKRQPQWRGR